MTSNIRLVRKSGHARMATPGVPLLPHRPIRTPKLGTEWWTQGWSASTNPIDERCREQVRLLGEAFQSCEDYEDHLDGRPFAEVDLDTSLPLELMQAVLNIPDEFTVPAGTAVLRKIDNGGVPGIRVCAPDGQVIGIAEPSDLLRLDYWLEWGAYWLLAISGVSVDAIRRTMNRELP